MEKKIDLLFDIIKSVHKKVDEFSIKSAKTEENIKHIKELLDSYSIDMKKNNETVISLLSDTKNLNTAVFGNDKSKNKGLINEVKELSIIRWKLVGAGALLLFFINFIFFK